MAHDSTAYRAFCRSVALKQLQQFTQLLDMRESARVRAALIAELFVYYRPWFTRSWVPRPILMLIAIRLPWPGDSARRVCGATRGPMAYTRVHQDLLIQYRGSLLYSKGQVMSLCGQLTLESCQCVKSRWSHLVWSRLVWLMSIFNLQSLVSSLKGCFSFAS